MAVTRWYGCPVHVLPGRVRVEVPGLYRNQSLARRLTAALMHLPGVRRAVASAATGYALVLYDPAATPLSAIGLTLGLRVPGRPPGQRVPGWGQARGAAGGRNRGPMYPPSPEVRQAAREALLTGAALATVAAKRLVLGPSPASTSWRTYDMAGFVTVAAGYPYLRRGIEDLMGNRRLSSDLVLGAAGLTLLLLRENVLGLSVLFLTSLNRLLAARVFQECQVAVDRLGPDRTRLVRVVRDQTSVLMPVAGLRTGDILLLRRSETLPTDGEVLTGSALVDPSIITGEAAPGVASAGDRLLAGTRLVDGNLRLRVTATGRQTELGRILQHVGHAGPVRHDVGLSRRHEEQAGRWGRWALGVACATGLVSGDWRRALASLIAAAPAAAALAAPLPLAAASAEAVRRGVLVKHTGAVAAAGLVDTVLFDKTGTLTAGRPQVAEVLPVNDEWPVATILAMAAAAEQHAFHPFGQAIREAVRERHLAVPAGRNREETMGQGAIAEVHHQRIAVGSEAMMVRRRALNPRARLLGQRLRLLGYAVVYVASDRQVIGVIGLADRIRPEAEIAMGVLRSSGITSLGLITGDHPDTAGAVASALGLAPAWAEASPEEKSRRIRALQASGRVVAMVGDGINDAPALAAADLGVALSHGYAVPTAGAADAVVVGGDPRKFAELVQVGRRAVEVVRQNQILAAGLNVIGLGLAASGAIGPLAATIWHNITALAVLGNSARLLRPDGRRPEPQQPPATTRRAPAGRTAGRPAGAAGTRR